MDLHCNLKFNLHELSRNAFREEDGNKFNFSFFSSGGNPIKKEISLRKLILFFHGFTSIF
jgi:hypothetical protein